MNYLAIILLFVLVGTAVSREWKVHSRMHPLGEYLDTDDYINPECLSRVEIVALFRQYPKNPVLFEAVISGKCYVRSNNNNEIVTKVTCLSFKDISVLYKKYPDNSVLLRSYVTGECVIKRQNNESNVELKAV